MPAWRSRDMTISWCRVLAADRDVNATAVTTRTMLPFPILKGILLVVGRSPVEKPASLKTVTRLGVVRQASRRRPEPDA